MLPNFIFFFFNDTATTEIYTLSLHDALPISWAGRRAGARPLPRVRPARWRRSEEHTSELQSRLHLVCRLLLEKKKQNNRLAPPLHNPYALRPAACSSRGLNATRRRANSHSVL